MLLDNEITAIAKQLAIELGYAEDKLLTIEEVAKMLGKSEEAIKKLCQRGRLPFHKHFGSTYFSSAEIKRHLLC